MLFYVFFETTLTHARIDELTTAGLWTGEHLFDRFAAAVEARSDQPLIIDEHGIVSWGEAAVLVDRLSAGLVAMGIRPGDVIQVQLPNRREFPILVLAAERIGAVINPIAPIFRTNEVTVMSQLARPKVVLAIDGFRGFALGEMHAQIREQSPWVEQLVVIDTGNYPMPADAMSFDALLGEGDAAPLSERELDLLRPSPNDVCEVIFTSGTTGQPKGVMHTQNTLNITADLWVERVAPDCSVFHMASTLAHQTGYLYGVRAPIFAGGAVVYQEVWDPTEFARLIETHGIEASMGATPFLADLMAVEGLGDRDLSSFKAFVCAGATIPLPVLEEARTRLPCTVLPGWGMSETGLSTIAQRDDPFEKLSTDGLILPGNEVRVVDPDGKPVSAGTEGDLQFRGCETFVGYVQGRELTESCFRDGWFDTGDRAIMDSDGYISISGRTKDIIIRGGENIPVKEVEDAILRHPAVVNVAVIAKPHNRLGEVGCAVILAEGAAPSLDDIVVFLDEQSVTKQFWPEDLIVVDEFPMTPSGKIQKFQLRALLDDH